MTSGTGAEVDHVIRATDGLLVVFDDQYGVAEIAQVFERGEQASVVTVMQTDGGLIQHVEHAAKFRADLGREADALSFAARKRGSRPAQRNVAEPNLVQKLKAFGDLMHDATGNRFFAARQLDLARRFQRARDRQRGEIRNRHAVHFHRQAFRTQPVTMTHRTLRRRHVIKQVFAVIVGTGGFEVLLKMAEHSEESGLAPAPRFAIQQQVLNFVGKFFKRRSQVDAIRFRHQLQSMGQILRGRPGTETAIQQRLGPVHNHFRGIEIVAAAQSVAFRACPV